MSPKQDYKQTEEFRQRLDEVIQGRDPRTIYSFFTRHELNPEDYCVEAEYRDGTPQRRNTDSIQSNNADEAIIPRNPILAKQERYQGIRKFASEVARARVLEGKVSVSLGERGRADLDEGDDVDWAYEFGKIKSNWGSISTIDRGEYNREWSNELETALRVFASVAPEGVEVLRGKEEVQGRNVFLRGPYFERPTQAEAESDPDVIFYKHCKETLGIRMLTGETRLGSKYGPVMDKLKELYEKTIGSRGGPTLSRMVPQDRVITAAEKFNAGRRKLNP